mgnify:CR=1 FL=1
MQLKEKIKSLAQEYHQEIIDTRRHLHAHPELSFHEYETSAYVIEMLKKLNIPYQEKVADTGVVAIIEGKNPGKTVALRADMDALPITEANDVPYKSTNPGVMHACGHDVHTSSLLGVAKILQEIKSEVTGTVKLIFQPGEEKAPGGASKMIAEGVLENPAPGSVLGQHVMPFIPVGKVGFKEGVYMASADEIYITVTGKGGHGAMPNHNIDPILIASHLIVALQQIVSRQAPPRTPTVLSFGHIIGQGATNVIPDQVYIEGTFRTLDEEWRFEAHERLRKIAVGLVEGMGGKVDVNIIRGYPFLYNSPELTSRTRGFAEEYLGKENVVDLETWMAAEDFSYYSQKADACFYRLGTRNEDKGIISSVHTPTFDIDEEALKIGMGLMSWLAIQELQT